MNLHILFNDLVKGDGVILGSTCLRVFRPSILQQSKDPHVEWLEFVSCFGRQGIKNDRRAGGVAEPLHVGSFMQCVTVDDYIKEWECRSCCDPAQKEGRSFQTSQCKFDCLSSLGVKL